MNTEQINKHFFYLLGFLLELLDGTLVDTTAFVDKMSSGGGLARVDVTDHDDVDMNLFLTHLADFRIEGDLWLVKNSDELKEKIIQFKVGQVVYYTVLHYHGHGAQEYDMKG